VKNLFLALLILFTTLTPVAVWSADKDDFYAEGQGALSLNSSGRFMFGGRVGYVFRDDLGVGTFYEQHTSNKKSTLDSTFYRSGLEFRWFQEPFEFSASLGLGRRVYRDGTSKMQILPAVSMAYLWSLTPSLAFFVDFSFLFVDDPRVLFEGGLGGRLLF